MEKRKHNASFHDVFYHDQVLLYGLVVTNEGYFGRNMHSV